MLRAGRDEATTEDVRKRLEAMTTAMMRNEGQRSLVLADATASDRRTVANAFHALTVIDLRPELSSIRVPVTVLYVTPEGVPMTAARIDAIYQASYAPLAGVQLVRLPDSDHLLMTDNPDRFKAERQALTADGGSDL